MVRRGNRRAAGCYRVTIDPIADDLHDLLAGISADLMERLDELVDDMFRHLARHPGLGDLPPDVEWMGRAVARADLRHELAALPERQLPDRCPPEVADTARRTAQLDAPLTIPLLCYRVGHRVLLDAYRRQAASTHAGTAELDAASRAAEQFFFDYADRCSMLLADEYAEQRLRLARDAEHRRLQTIRALLEGDVTAAGDALARSGLRGTHVAFVAVGGGASELDRRLRSSVPSAVVVAPDIDVVWGWLPGARVEIRDAARSAVDVTVGVGTPDAGLDGLRRSHRRAQGALAVALRQEIPHAAYADVALEATLLTGGEVAARDFVDHELAALDAPSARPIPLHETLVVYFQLDQNMAATAARLGVHANTIANRIRVAEQRLGRTVAGRRVELEAALRLRGPSPPSATRGPY